MQVYNVILPTPVIFSCILVLLFLTVSFQNALKTRIKLLQICLGIAELSDLCSEFTVV